MGDQMMQSLTCSAKKRRFSPKIGCCDKICRRERGWREGTVQSYGACLRGKKASITIQEGREIQQN